MLRGAYRGGRFRFNFLTSLGGPMAVARPVGGGAELDFVKLNLPPVVTELCRSNRGLILVAGSPGSGKSTTQGAMVNFINRNFGKHILTIEDPVEFVHHDLKSLITQREINSDVVGFGAAFRAAMRDNPDVIVIGELCDRETVSVAINVAMIGHLVISALHTSNVVQAVERVINPTGNSASWRRTRVRRRWGGGCCCCRAVSAA